MIYWESENIYTVLWGVMMLIKKIGVGGRAEALKLVLDVFMQYEAPDYIQEGIEAFKSFIGDEDSINGLEMYGAYENDIVVGVIATRNNGTHISLFFVDGRYHKQGIGRKLFEKTLSRCTSDTMTVNSSPYAVKVYCKLGFTETNSEQLVDGIRFTPMKHVKSV